MSSYVLSSIYLNLFILLQVSTTRMKYNEYIVDTGSKITITCDIEETAMWMKETENATRLVQIGRDLSFINVTRENSGLYTCMTSVKNNIINEFNSSENFLSIEDYNNEYHPYLKIVLTVKTSPGPVDELYFKASTILGYLIWKFNKTNSGGYPIRSFTAEYRNISEFENETYEWNRLDPINISPNVRQMEVYHLTPNTTYEFRIWANNQLGAGVIITTNVTTLPETKEEDLLKLILTDVQHFDPRVWFVAVTIALGTLIILAIGLCLLLAKECCLPSSFADEEEDWESIDLVPNIILNPGFCENDEPKANHILKNNRKLLFEEDDESDGYDYYEEPISLKKKLSIFFTGDTIKRI